jgi:hypothetical protein
VTAVCPRSYPIMIGEENGAPGYQGHGPANPERLTSAPKPGTILTMSTTANVQTDWKFRILLRDARPRRLILEGNASPPYERPYHDALYFYAVMGLDYLSLEVSRDFDGERLLDYLFVQLGAPEEPPRIQVGGRQDEEEGALLLVEWRFPADRREDMLRRLEEIMGQSLAG